MDIEEQINVSQREHAFISRGRGIVHWVVDHLTKEMGAKQRDIWGAQTQAYMLWAPSSIYATTV